MIEKNHQTWEQSAEENEKSMVDSVRDDAEEIIEAASEAIEKSSVTLAKELEDIASHWRRMTVVAVAVALAIGCAAAIFLCPQYVLCFTRYCLVRCRHKERRSNEAARSEREFPTEVPTREQKFEPMWMPPVNVKGRGSVATRESDRNDSLNVLSEKGLPDANCEFNRSDSLNQSASGRFIHRWQGKHEENENKKRDGATEGSKLSGTVEQMQPEPTRGTRMLRKGRGAAGSEVSQSSC
ncbi:hypothetical protein Tcan_06730 [Toxocara canis]|nr:hypothetical protein Tcan_06730 [Toxocara canis]